MTRRDLGPVRFSRPAPGLAASALKYALSAAVICAGTGEAGAIHSTEIPTPLSPPVISTLFDVRPAGAFFRQYTSNVLCRNVATGLW